MNIHTSDAYNNKYNKFMKMIDKPECICYYM